MAARVARHYRVHLGPSREVAFTLPAQPGEPLAPLLIYAGGEHALLRRNAEDDIILDYIHPDARRFLSQARLVTVAERPTGERPGQARDYLVTVGLVEVLPPAVAAALQAS